MQRIKDTAHRPPAGWDPFVGHGVVDALAAVSGDTNTAPMAIETDTQQRDDPRPLSPPANGIQPDPSGRRIAFGGAGICVAVVTAAVAMTASLGRLRRRGDTVARD